MLAALAIDFFSGNQRSLDRGKIDLLAVNLGLNSTDKFPSQRHVPCRARVLIEGVARDDGDRHPDEP